MDHDRAGQLEDDLRSTRSRNPRSTQAGMGAKLLSQITGETRSIPARAPSPVERLANRFSSVAPREPLRRQAAAVLVQGGTSQVALRPRPSDSSRYSPEGAYVASGSRPAVSPLDAPVAITVAVRARPLTDTELDAGDEDVWEYEPEHGRVYERDIRAVHARDHTFGHLFPPGVRTSEIYERLGLPVVQSALQGINGTIFAYGQTGSGKTYTVNGTSEEPGLLPVAVSDVFRMVQSDGGSNEYLIRASYMEIYNEELYDLFDPDGSSNLRIVDGAMTGPYVRGLTEEVVTTSGRVMELLAIGEANRHVAATKMNANSSRSHTVFRLIIESRPVMPGSGSQGGMSNLALTVAGNAQTGTAPLLTKAGDTQRPPPSLLTNGNGIVRLASLHVVDLAGSERVGKSQVVGEALKEASGINVSLLTLGVVILKLTSGEPHVPYRDSKLTRLLSTSLGGNAKTSIVVCISPARYNVSESRSSLTFASRAMKVLNRVRINEVADEQSLLERYKAEIEKLQRLLADERQSRAMLLNQSHRGGDISQSDYDDMKSSLEDKLHSLQEQLQRVQSECRDTTITCTDLLQLLFVFSHGAGHVRSLPTLLQVLADVSNERLLPGAATRSILSTIPKFALRVARMARSGEAPVIAGSALESEAITLAGGVEVVDGSAGSATRRGQGMLSVSALRSPQLQRTPARDVSSPQFHSPGQMSDSGGLSEDIEGAVFDGTVEYFTPGSAARQIRALLSLRESFASQLRDAQEAVALKQAELDLMKRRSETSESREAELHNKAIAAEEQAAVDAALLRAAREEATKLQQEINRMKAEAAVQAREHAALVQRSERQVGEYDEQLRAVRLSLARETGDRAELQTELEGVRLKLIDSEQTVQGLVKEVEAARVALLTAKEELATLTSERASQAKDVSHLKTLLQGAEARADAAHRDIEALKNQAVEQSSRHSTVQSRCDQLQAARSALQGSLETAQAAIAQLQKEKQLLADRLADSQREASAVRLQLSAREAELQSTGEGREHVEKDLMMSRHSMAEKDMKLRELEGRLHATGDEVAALRAQLADSLAQLLSTRTKLDGKRAQIADLSALLEARCTEVAQLQADVVQKEHRLHDLEMSYGSSKSELATELDRERGKCSSLVAQLTDAKNELKELNQRNEELQARAVAADKQAQDARGAAESLQHSLRDVSARAAADSATLEGQLQRSAQALSAAKGETESVLARLQSLQDRYTAVQSQLNAATVGHAQEQAAHEQTRETLSQTKKALLQAQADLSAAQSKNADLSSKLAAKTSELSSTSALLALAQSACTAAKEDAKRVMEELEAKAAMCRSLSHEHDRLLDELAAAERKADTCLVQLTQEQAGHVHTRDVLEQTKKALLASQADGARGQEAIAELSSKLAAKTSELSVTAASLAALQGSCASLREEMQRLQGELDTKSALHRALSSEHARSLDTIAEVQGKAAALQAHLQQEQAAHAQSRDALASTRKQLSALNADLASGNDSRAASERQVTLVTADLAAAKERLAESDGQLQQTKASLEALLQKYDALDSAFSSGAQDVARHLKQLEVSAQRIQLLEDTLQQKEQQVEAHKQEMAEATSSWAAQARKSADELTILLAERDRLQGEVARLQYGAELLVAERTKLADSLQRATADSTSAQARFEAQLEAERSAHAQALVAAEDRARESLRLALAELDALTKSRDRTVQHMNMLQAERDNFRDRSVALEAEKVELMNRLGEVSREVDDALLVKAQQAEALRQREQACEELESGLNFTREALEEEIRARKEATAAGHRAEMEKQALQAAVDRAEVALEEARRALHVEQGRTRELEAQCDELRVQLQASMGGAASTHSTVDDLRKRLGQYEQLTAAQSQTVATLREEVKQQIQEAQAAKAGMLKLQTRLSVALSERDRLSADVESASSQADGAKARLAQAHKQAADSAAEVARLNKEIAQLKAVIQSSVSNKQLLQATVANIRAEVQQASGRASVYQGKLSATEAMPSSRAGPDGGAASFVTSFHSLGSVSSRADAADSAAGSSSFAQPTRHESASEPLDRAARQDVSMSSTELSSSFLYSPIASASLRSSASGVAAAMGQSVPGSGPERRLPSAQELRDSLKPAARR